MWKKLKWWQWALIVFFGTGILGSLVNGPPPPTAQQTKRFASPDAEFTSIARNSIFAMTFNEHADPDALPDLAREHCGSRSWCQVLGWTDAKFAARGMPMTDREVGQLAFSYSLNRETGYEQALWNCTRWKRPDAAHCLADLNEAPAELVTASPSVR
jgi:hypothetical protein